LEKKRGTERPREKTSTGRRKGRGQDLSRGGGKKKRGASSTHFGEGSQSGGGVDSQKKILSGQRGKGGHSNMPSGRKKKRISQKKKRTEVRWTICISPKSWCLEKKGRTNRLSWGETGHTLKKNGRCRAERFASIFPAMGKEYCGVILKRRGKPLNRFQREAHARVRAYKRGPLRGFGEWLVTREEKRRERIGKPFRRYWREPFIEES